MFFGHTHNDSWQVLYDPVNYTRPVATAFITPSGKKDLNISYTTVIVKLIIGNYYSKVLEGKMPVQKSLFSYKHEPKLYIYCCRW